MAKTLILMVSTILILGVTAIAQADYKSEVNVIPIEGSNMYVVKFNLKQAAQNDNSDVPIVPEMMVTEGKESRMETYDSKKQFKVVCTALITAEDKGTKAVTSIVIDENGVEQLNAVQNIVLEK